MRRAARVDATQPAIVQALRQVGADVEVIGLPLDLLVAWRGRTLLLECKSKGGKVRTKKQKDFVARWRGEFHVVESPLEAIAAVTGGVV